MINVRTATMLAHYKQWVDQRLFESLASLPPDEVGKERQTLCKSIIGTLNHIYMIDCIWQAHLEHREHGYKTRLEVPHPELDDLPQKYDRSGPATDRRTGRASAPALR